MDAVIGFVLGFGVAIAGIYVIFDMKDSYHD